MRAVVLVLAALIATGCAAQRQAKLSADMGEADVYCQTLAQRPEVAPVRDKLAILADPTFEQLADRTRPNAVERKAIAALGGFARLCADKIGIIYAEQVPQLAPAWNAATGRGQAALAQLYNSEITFGQANAAGAENRQMFNQAVASYNQSVSQQEAARSAAIAATIGQGFRNAAAAYGQAAQSYRTSSCRWMGSTWSCTSF